MLSFLIRNRYNNPDLITWFIEKGAPIHYVDEQSYPLADVIFYGYDFKKKSDNAFRKIIHYDLVNYLIAHGAKLEMEDYKQIMNSDNEELKTAIKDVELFNENEAREKQEQQFNEEEEEET